MKKQTTKTEQKTKEKKTTREVYSRQVITKECQVMSKNIEQIKDFCKESIVHQIEHNLPPIRLAVSSPIISGLYNAEISPLPIDTGVKIIEAKPQLDNNMVSFTQETDTFGDIIITGKATVPDFPRVITQTNSIHDVTNFIGVPANSLNIERIRLDFTNTTAAYQHVQPQVILKNSGEYEVTWTQNDTAGFWSGLTNTYGGFLNPINPQEHLKNQIKSLMKSNLLIKIGKKNLSRNNLEIAKNTAEIRARETLRDMIIESEWRRYVTNGFIMVKGKSGRWYQVFNKHHEKIRVYENNKHIENICIHSDTTCPPTDHVINMKVLIEIDEQEIIKGGNVYKSGNFLPTVNQILQGTNNNFKPKLIEEYQKLKAA